MYEIPLSPVLPMSFGPALWFGLQIAALVLFCCVVDAVLRTLPTEGTAAASLKAFKCITAALMVLYSMGYVLPALFGVAEEGHEGVMSGLLESIYAILLTMGIQASPGEAIELAKGFVDTAIPSLSPLLEELYDVLLLLFCCVAPISLAMVAVTQIWGILRRWQHVLVRGSHTRAYLLSGLGDAEVALAEDLLRNHEDLTLGRPLVIFCGIDQGMRDENGELISTLQDLGRGSAIFSHRAITDVLNDLEKPARLILRLAHRFDQIHCFLLGDDYAANVDTAIDVIEGITNRALAEHDGDLEGARGDARRFSVYCMHDNQENELVFDSLAYGSTDVTVNDALSPEVRAVRLSVTVRLISRAREQAFDLLTRHPLYRVLDRPAYPTESSEVFEQAFFAEHPLQQLYVFVVGLGSYGMEAFKTAYWIGRMRGVQLHLVGIDKCGTEIEDYLGVVAPGMMAERVPGTEEPVVRIVEAAAFTKAFDDAVRSVPKEARIYAVIALGDDQLNLNVALLMRRTFDDMIRTGALDKPVDENRDCEEYPLILPLINSSELYAAADRMTSEKDEAFRLEPFGETSRVFSYQGIVDEPWERYALAMNAAYREVWDGGLPGSKGIDSVLERDVIAAEYAEYEIKKLSNRTNVRHIPYRLWCLGLRPEDYLNLDGTLTETPISLDLWRRIMKYDADGAALLMSQLTGEGDIELICTSLGCDAKTAKELRKKFNSAREDSLAKLSDEQKDVLAQAKVLQKRTMRQQQDDLRRAHAVICAMADLEHERWLAFYHSVGWRDLPIEECDKLVGLGLIRDRQVHQSPKLRLHCYLCSNEELLDRGVDLGDDPYAYDRAAVLETPRILSGSIFKS